MVYNLIYIYIYIYIYTYTHNINRSIKIVQYTMYVYSNTFDKNR